MGIKPFLQFGRSGLAQKNKQTNKQKWFNKIASGSDSSNRSSHKYTEEAQRQGHLVKFFLFKKKLNISFAPWLYSN